MSRCPRDPVASGFVERERRTELATAARRALPQVHAAVIESWADLLPAAAGWSETSAARAREAASVALSGIAAVIEQGDLDDRGWARTQLAIHGHGHATSDEAAELLRTVRVVGVEVLGDVLAEQAGLTAGERWQLQQDASTFCDRLLGLRERPSAEALQEVLAELAASGPDLR